MTTMNDDELLAALGVEVTPVKVVKRTPREERIIAGFEDIIRFYETHGHAPRKGYDLDIFERLYSVRLEQIRKLPEAHTLLADIDSHGLLTASNDIPADINAMDADALLAELGIADAEASQNDMTVLRHVRSSAEKRAAEEIAHREKCEDFELFEDLFERVERELKSGSRQTRPFGNNVSIEVGHWFVLSGQMAYVAEEGEDFDSPQGKKDARLRVIFSNGTQSNMLRLSLVRALYKDETSRRITSTDMGPLFGDAAEEDDIKSGTIYVLRSQSSHPFVTEHRELIHKIGVTGGKVETRIANAAKDATYLLADVEIVATYTLHNINRTKLENIFHRVFAAAQLDLTIEDRFGNPVKPQEWFLVPLHVIDEVVERIRDGSISNVTYNVYTAGLE
jgi:hypothetical protein